MNNLEELFRHFLRDIYYAEKKVLKELPTLARKSDSPELRNAFEDHHAETQQQVENLERVFEELGLTPSGITCEAIDGIVAETKEIISESENGDVRDAGMIAAAQAVEHYEITRYGTMIAWAKTLGHDHVVPLLQANLDQEYAADTRLSALAEGALNREAA